MLRVTLVDDVEEDRKCLQHHLEQIQKDTGTEIQMKMYASPLDLLEEYRSDCDVLLLDVEMPGTNGIELAREIREKDEAVGIIFITNMAQYAVAGYEVDATDYIIKPVQYYSFAQKLKRAAEHAERHRNSSMLFPSDDGVTKVDARDIYWMEKDRNYLVWHTAMGVFREKGTVDDARERLKKAEAADAFSECNAGTLVNLRWVEKLGKDIVTVHGEILTVSRRLRKDFLQAFMEWH